jgi:hypothetical protein
MTFVEIIPHPPTPPLTHTVILRRKNALHMYFMGTRLGLGRATSNPDAQ